MKSLHSFFVALVAITTAGAPAFGAVYSSGELAFPTGSNNPTATFTPPASLIQGLTPTATGGNPPMYVASGFGSWATVNDGIVGPATLASQTILLDSTTGTFAPAYAIFVLDTSVNTLGYDIFSIQSFAGWVGERIWQNIEIKYALVGESISGELTHSLGSFSYVPEGLTNENNNASKLTIEDNFGEVMLSGVSAIQISYLNNGYNGGVNGGANYTAYKELSVVGYATAPIPEPSSILLLGVAAAGVLLRFRRK